MKIYFFTGTGNAYMAALYLAELADRTGMKVTHRAIDRLSGRDMDPGEKGDLTGFIFPTHGFSLPWCMLRFILRYPRGKGKVFIINTRAGMKMGRLFTPGLSGIAVHLPIIILWFKGYKIAGTLPLDTPSNWISVHPGLRPKVINSIFERRKRDLERLWRAISGEHRFFPIKYLVFIPLDLLLIPVSAGYMIFGRFLLARSYFPDEKCDGCGICADRCPTGSIRMKNMTPYWSYSCESCMRCTNVCPRKSVNSSVPFLILASWLLSILASYTGPLRSFWLLIDSIAGHAGIVLYYIVLWIITMIGSYILYNLFMFLRNLPGFNLLLSRSTPMYWWRRYIAPGFRGLYEKKIPGRES